MDIYLSQAQKPAQKPTGSPSSRHERILISVDLQGIIWRLLNFWIFTLTLNKI